MDGPSGGVIHLEGINDNCKSLSLHSCLLMCPRHGRRGVAQGVARQDHIVASVIGIDHGGTHPSNLATVSRWEKEERRAGILTSFLGQLECQQ